MTLNSLVMEAEIISMLSEILQVMKFSTLIIFAAILTGVVVMGIIVEKLRDIEDLFKKG